MHAEELISNGLQSAAEGIADLRQDIERVACEQARRREGLVDAEFRLRGLSLQAMRARRPRHLQPGETTGPRRKDRDGELARPPITDEKVHWQTHESLERMGLSFHGPSEPTKERLQHLFMRIVIRP